ncbi:MAG TPA: transglycosylase domain-containing protein [Longimicrobium sp.]|nr:transglycosylase domain-containing protein [Longimicrobium sp.]
MIFRSKKPKKLGGAPPKQKSRPKGKALGGAARGGKWTRGPEETRLGGRHRNSLIALGVLALLLVAGAGVYLGLMNWQLQRGLLKQRSEMRGRADWVRLRELPAHVPLAFAVALDTGSATTRAPLRRATRPAVSRELVRQVYRLGGGLRDGAREMALTPLLEARTSDAELLELYLNRVYMGRTEEWPVYGLHHAARDYFNKEPRQLSLSEAATLAGILLAPRMEDPEAEPGAVGARRNEVLRMLLARGRIGAAQYRAAVAEPLSFQPGEDYAPMSRPLDWKQDEVPVIRLPEALRPNPDSLAANRPQG